jgi:hypothetical protein
VDTTFGLQVMWDRIFSVRVLLSADHMKRVCGMCGDFDDNPDNDWIIGPNDQLCSYSFGDNRTMGQKVRGRLVARSSQPVLMQAPIL